MHVCLCMCMLFCSAVHVCVSECACECHNNDHLTLLSIPQGSTFPFRLHSAPGSRSPSLSPFASSVCFSRLGTVGEQLLIHS